MSVLSYPRIYFTGVHVLGSGDGQQQRLFPHL